MKKIIFLLIFIVNCLNLSAQWRRQYIPKDELTGAPSMWSYIYSAGEGKSIAFVEPGILMIASKYQKFKTDVNDNTLVLVGIYKNDHLISKGQFVFPVTPDGHAAGTGGFDDYLKLVRSGAVIRVVAHVKNDFDFDVTTTKMYEGQRVIFNQNSHER